MVFDCIPTKLTKDVDVKALSNLIQIGPALSEGLEQMTSKGPLQCKLFCDFYIEDTPKLCITETVACGVLLTLFQYDFSMSNYYTCFCSVCWIRVSELVLERFRGSLLVFQV